jgi:cell division protein FtsA
MPKAHSYIASLDIGSTRVRALIALPVPDRDRWTVAGYGDVSSRGVRKGVVVNIEAAEESIRHAIADAEQMAGVEIDTVHAGLSGMHVKSYNGQGVVAISHRNREITAPDVQRVIEQASAVSLPSDRSIVEVLPQEFVVDEQDGIGDPLGMLGMRLGATIHIVTSPITATQNIVTSVNRLGMIVDDLTLGSLAAAESTLTEEEREYGAALIDIGGEITSLAIYQRGAVRHTAMFPLGGAHFTSDIAVGLRSSVPEAERIKRAFGCSFAPLLHHHEREETFDVASSGGRIRALSRQLLCDILQPRAEEVFLQIQEEIRRSGFERKLSSGLILTGGGSLLSGIPELAERMLDVPVRVGATLGLDGISGDLESPEYATLIGLTLHGARQRHQSFLRQKPTRWRELLVGIKNIFSSTGVPR